MCLCSAVHLPRIVSSHFMHTFSSSLLEPLRETEEKANLLREKSTLLQEKKKPGLKFQTFFGEKEEKLSTLQLRDEIEIQRILWCLFALFQ